MIINETKSSYNIFSMSNNLPNLYLKINNELLAHVPNPIYLGVKLDKKLNFNEHINFCVAKGESRINLLKRLCSSQWGANLNTLLDVYKIYIRPHFTYGNELLICASDTAKQKLIRLENKFLRLLTGGVKTCPISAMQAVTKIEPLDLFCEKNALKLFERIKRSKNSCWSFYVPSEQRLSSKKSFFHCISLLYRKYNIENNSDVLHFSTYDRLSIAISNPFVYMRLRNQINVKSNAVVNELKVNFLETANFRFPTDSWYYIFTDGSLDIVGNSGAGVFSEKFFISAPCGINLNICEIELRAIYFALEKVFRLRNNLKKKKFVFFIDSQSALFRIKNFDCNEEYLCKIKYLIHKLQNFNKVIAFQWIPSHIDVYGNDQADFLAKEGCNLSQHFNSISYESVKCKLNTIFTNKFSEYLSLNLDSKPYNILLNTNFASYERRIFVANFRRITQHDLLNEYLARFKIKHSNICGLCLEEPQSSIHLFNCPALLCMRNVLKNLNLDEFEVFSKLYWHVREMNDCLQIN